MQQMIKTTITVPEAIFHTAKLTALQEKITLSQLIRDALYQRIIKQHSYMIRNPMKVLGKFKIGIQKKPYTRRSELYESHFKRISSY